jgi:putative hydrolase of the HAD superfamily
MRWEAVIFDLYGTLVDNFSFLAHERVIAEMSQALGLPEEEFAPLWEGTLHGRHTGRFASIEDNLRYICEALRGDADERSIRAATAVRLRFCRHSLVPRAGAVEVLRTLRGRGYKIGLISDCAPDVPRLWGETPFASLVHVPIFSCVAGFKKPQPQIYRLACRELAVDPSGCLYMGDGSSRELSGARKVGARAVLYRIPLENVYDGRREDVESWQGPEVSALSDVLDLVSEDRGGFAG